MIAINQAESCVEIIRERGLRGEIEAAVVLGTGLGSLADALEDPLVIPYADLPGFPVGSISGHAGRLVIGTQEGTRVAYLQGRSHYYESGDPATMFTPLDTLHKLGVQIVVLTNSSGSCRADIAPGSLALITDHINFNGQNPLLGSGGDHGFVSMVDAYDPRLLRRFKHAASLTGTALHEAVYMWFSGPSFETAAEIRMARTLGADLVGMSTVPEVIIARRLGLRVGALSMVTNYATGVKGGHPTHGETKDMALKGSISLKRLVRTFLRTKEDVWSATTRPQS
ncbi:MAG: purine-nucleoside phosphorylase [Hyphomicrobiales bacterium]|nr:purine-nucleoside phosphorylase [Hyphomicrobiales bacterium]